MLPGGDGLVGGSVEALTIAFGLKDVKWISDLAELAISLTPINSTGPGENSHPVVTNLYCEC